MKKAKVLFIRRWVLFQSEKTGNEADFFGANSFSTREWKKCLNSRLRSDWKNRGTEEMISTRTKRDSHTHERWWSLIQPGQKNDDIDFFHFISFFFSSLLFLRMSRLFSSILNSNRESNIFSPTSQEWTIAIIRHQKEERKNTFFFHFSISSYSEVNTPCMYTAILLYSVGRIWVLQLFLAARSELLVVVGRGEK